MSERPRLADVHCTPLRFQPGDRILVKVYHRLDPEQVKKLKHTVEKWAGVPVEILVYCGLDMEITVEKRTNEGPAIKLP